MRWVLLEGIFSPRCLQLSCILTQTIQHVREPTNATQLRTLDQLEEQCTSDKGIAPRLMCWSNSVHLQNKTRVLRSSVVHSREN